MKNKLRLLKCVLVTLMLVLFRLPQIYYYKRRGNSKKLNLLRVDTFKRICKYSGGVKLNIINREGLHSLKGPYIICGNHSSYFDIGCLLVAAYELGLKDAFFITKKDLTRNFLVKHYINNLDVAIDREDKLDAVKGLKLAQQKIKEGKTLLLFPEGTICKQYPPTLQEFKKGALGLAIKLGIPLIPVTIANAWKILHNVGQDHGLGKGTMDVIIHKPIRTDGLKSEDLEPLTLKVKDIMRDTFQQYNP